MKIKPESASFDYAILRVVPRVERQEFVNVGVIVFCLERRILEARVHLDEARLQALWSGLDLEIIRQHIQAVVRICEGDPTAGQIALLPQRERFHWLTAPRSTMIQTSSVHTGICADSVGVADRLFKQLVLREGVDC
jgi:Protein of unknown function (DUF3037)